MTDDRITGNVIGSSFGLAFILANLGALPGAVAWGIRLLAILVALGVFLRLFRSGAAGGVVAGAPGDNGPRSAMFGRAYWLIVAGEVVIGLVGLVLFNAALDWPVANVPWIVLVVGGHFLLLARVWREPSIQVLGGALSVLGVIGFALAALGVSASGVRLVAGAGAGAILLGSAWWAASRPGMDAEGG